MVNTHFNQSPHLPLSHSLQIQENDNEWKDHAIIEDSLAYTVKDLNPTSTYRFRVLAENVHGRSEPSSCSEDVCIDSPTNGRHTEVDSKSSASFNLNNGSGEVSVQSGGDYKTRFLVQEELGKGRFGIVHKVTEIETGQTLAAKTVKCIKAADKVKVSSHPEIHICYNRITCIWILFQIHDEISIMRALKHSKLLQLFAFFETQREIIMILE